MMWVTKMLRGVFLSAWHGGKTTLLTVMVALTLAAATPAFGANGGAFILGSLNNSATAITRLVGNVNGPALYIVNPNTGASATGALFQVASGHPPFKVTSSTKVPNLNADLVDGETFSCPSGMLLHEGVCIQTTKKTAATWNAAENTCLGERSRLPTVAELQTFRSRIGQDFTSAEWTGELDITDTDQLAHTVIGGDSGTEGYASISLSFPYRCVAATRP